MSTGWFPLVERGSTFRVNFNRTLGHEQNGIRPAIAVSFPELSAGGTMIVVPTTTQRLDKVRPYEVLIEAGDGVPQRSKALVHQLRVIDIEERVIEPIARVSQDTLDRIDFAVLLVMGLVA